MLDDFFILDLLDSLCGAQPARHSQRKNVLDDLKDINTLDNLFFFYVIDNLSWEGVSKLNIHDPKMLSICSLIICEAYNDFNKSF